MSTVHIESKKDNIAKIVLMPGDPKRAEYIAKKYLKKAKLINRVRGMTAYTGYYKDKMITIFPSGMGNPSMGIYSYELYKEYDVEKIIRLGSCGAYQKQLQLNDLILVGDSISESVYDEQLNNYQGNRVSSTVTLNNDIIITALKNNIELQKGNIYCSDTFYEKEDAFYEKVQEFDVLGVEMETFALFNNAKLFNKEASALLTVSDSFITKKRLPVEEREKGLDKMIILALESAVESYKRDKED